MTIRTMSTSSGGDWTHGWKTVTLKECKYGTYNNEVRYVDAWFDEYPSTINLRLYEAKSKDGEEFAIARLFKLANAGIVGEVKDSSGKKMIQFDDDAVNLNGTQIQVFFYRNEEGYFRVLNRIAPVVQQGEFVSYDENSVKYWKGQAEKYYEQYKKPANSDNGMMSMTTDEIKETLSSNKETKTQTDDAPF